MSYFSSNGPAVDGRIKPDISVMGDSLYSARAVESATLEHCSVITMSGTSMATPLAASATAIIIQYFKEGYYYDGEKDESYGKTPTSALVKAMLIHSTENLRGESNYAYNRLTEFTSWPNNKQGFGAVSLERVLYFKNDPHFRLFTSEECIDKGGNEIVYNFYYNISF